MARQRATVIRSFRQLFHSGSISGLDDRQLLERFISQNDESAFAALLALHGPMVLGVCRRLLRDEPDVEDAFQATFLVLVKRARSIRDPGRLGPWLYGVARRVAMRARADSLRRRSRQTVAAQISPREEAIVRPLGCEDEDLLAVIDQEVGLLPARYRDAVILCDLEGRSYAEAARRLRCRLGTLQSRLARGRSRLRARLIQRGVAPALLAAAIAESARAAVPEALAAATIRAATAGPVSASAAALAGAVLRSMLFYAVPKIAVALCLVVTVISGGILASGRVFSDPPASAARVVDLPPAKEGRTLTLEVVDRTDRGPVVGATVWVRANSAASGDSQGATDEDGRYTITLPAGSASYLQIAVVNTGYAPIELRWSGSEPIPDSYTVALDRGVPIGGTVHDRAGRPIGGARVHLRLGANVPLGRLERYASAESEAAGAVTDAQGRWRCEALPASVAAGARLELVIVDSNHVALTQPVTAAALRAFATDSMMTAGKILSGTVASPTGRPVGGATITVQPRATVRTIRKVQSDRDGRFRTGPFIDPDWREFTIVVSADGFASYAQMVLVSSKIPSQTIRLSPRKPLSGTVVDSQGRPVEGAAVRSATEFGYAGLEWQAETGADGRFVWYDAPAAGNYLLNIQKPPFRQIIARLVAGGTDEITVTLHRAQRIHGAVTDAETGRPIDRVDVISGTGPHRIGWPPDWNLPSRRSFGGGKFELTGPDFEQDVYKSIRIEAEGYEPADFIRFHDSLEDVRHDFQLHKAVSLAGVVRGPDGRPLAGADVVVVGAGFGFPFKNGRLTPNSGHDQARMLRTDSDGRYAFPSQKRGVSVVAVHDAGYAIRLAAELASAPDLTLAPWGRIEGVLKIGTRPASGQRVGAWVSTSGFYVGYEARTGASGQFALERVAPGRLTVYHRVDHQDHQGWTLSHPVSLDVKPGETVHVQVGGSGRPVIGRLAIPQGSKLDYFTLGDGELVLPRREPPAPANFLELNSEERSAWWSTFYKTAEGRRFVEDRDRAYAVNLQPDGAFRVEDVPAGRYILKLSFEGLSRATREGQQALARSEAVVAEMPGGRSDEPIDVGTIPLDVFPFHEPKVGDRAPVIAINPPDGRPLDLASLRGKFVLLHFWSGRPEDAATVPFLKATYDAFGRDGRFVMLGLIADETPGIVRRFAALRGLSWEHRFIGSTYDPNPVEAAFGVWFPPAVFLIGPDGRILGKDLEGEAIPKSVAKALK